MIQSVLSVFDNTIKALPFVQRYGGLVYRVELRDREGNAEYYPVSCSVTAQDCFETGKYKALAPDDKYTSVLFWDQITPVSIAYKSPKVYRATATVRLVGWFNLNRLGITSCDGFDAVLIYSLITGKGLSVSTPIKAGSIRLEFEEVEIKGPDIFSRYSYKGLE